MSDNSGKNNSLYFIVGALLVAVLGLGYVLMQDKADKPDLSISVGEDGIEVDGN